MVTAAMLESEDPSMLSRPTALVMTAVLTEAERIAKDYELIINKFMAAGFEQDSPTLNDVI
jgi:hypothetical protein